MAGPKMRHAYGLPRGVRVFTSCPRGHELIPGNLTRPTDRNRLGSCKACTVAHQWAKRHNLFNNDPRTLEHADALFAGYVANSVDPTEQPVIEE